MEKNLVHIYYGDGKGKTTAAAGAACRAAGAGLSVCFAQFLKNGKSNEIRFLNESKLITVFSVSELDGFLFAKSEKEKKKIQNIHNANMNQIIHMTETGMFDLVVLDEVLDAIRLENVDRSLVMDFVKAKRAEIILTGREPDEEFLDLADYGSKIRKIKHPYDKGIQAREGIDY